MTKGEAAHLLQRDPYPLVPLAADVKEPSPVADVSYLLVLVEVLMEKTLDLVLVHVAHLVRADGNLVAVLVTPL